MDRQGRRRGGPAAAGGPTLSDAAPVPVASEAELRGELERVLGLLAPAVEWTQRVDALLRLEGLVKGGAADFAAFPELLGGHFRDALAAQMQERRSAVSRQACHAVGELAAACGAGFEPLAVHLLPVVFKSLAMGIQIVTEAADACAHAMLVHCPCHRLLPKLCTVVCSDRNGRLRQSAAEFLLRALEGWQPAEWERQMEAVERAALAAAQDAQAETRVVGRSLFGAYAAAWPAQAAAALARLGRGDRQLQEKLAAVAQEYEPGLMPEGSFVSQPLSRMSSLGNSGANTPRGGLPRTSSMPAAVGSQQVVGAGGPLRLASAVPKLALSALSSACGSPTNPSSARGVAAPSAAALPPRPATARENQPDNRAPAVSCTPRSMFPKTLARREAAAAADAAEPEAVDAGRQAAAGRERHLPRRSLGGAALRMSVAAFRREADEPADEAAAQRQRAALRAPLPPLQLPQVEVQQPQDQVAVRPAASRRLDRQTSSIPEDSEVSSVTSSQWEEAYGGCGTPTVSLVPLLASLGKAGVGWADRVALFQSVQAALQQSGVNAHAAADVASNADRLVPVLLEGSGDAHFRVAAAALAALGEGLGGAASRVFEPQLDRVMTALFARVVDPKEQIRQLVCACLAAVLQQHSADAIVAALGRSLAANRAPRVKCAVMDYFAAAARGGSGDGTACSQEQAPPLLQQLAGAGAGLATLLRSLLQLATDKNPDIRRAAASAVVAAYHGGEARAVLAAVQALPPADALAVQRAIGPAIHQRGGDAQVPLQRPGSRAASSRRQSGEGLTQLGSQQELQRRADSGGSPGATSQQSSHAASPPPGLQPPAAMPAAAAPAQLTPQPPSPFVWGAQSQSASPLAQQTTENAAEQASMAPLHTQPAPDALQLQPQQYEPIVPAVRASELAPFDDVMAGQPSRLLAQLEAGPSSEALQGLSRLVHVLPAAAWPPCFEQVTVALCEALDSGSPVVRDAGLMLVRDLAAAAQPSLFLPALPALLPRLLACAAEQDAREVAATADEALEQLLQRAPPQTCLGLLVTHLPTAAAALPVDRQAGGELHAVVRSLRRVVARMQPAGLAAHLHPLLLPGLCVAYGSPLADVRKATVDCLVAVWQVVGDTIRPHLEQLSTSQLKLLQIYYDKARRGAA